VVMSNRKGSQSRGLVSGDGSIWVACFVAKVVSRKVLGKEKKLIRVAPGFASRGFDPRPEEPYLGYRAIVWN
jgi:hypothetical protein